MLNSSYWDATILKGILHMITINIMITMKTRECILALVTQAL
jgi:hypothetical protein